MSNIYLHPSASKGSQGRREKPKISRENLKWENTRIALMRIEVARKIALREEMKAKGKDFELLSGTGWYVSLEYPEVSSSYNPTGDYFRIKKKISKLLEYELDKEDRIELLEMRATLHEKTNLFRFAVEDYQAILELEPKKAMINFKLAILETALKQCQAALDHFGQSIELFETNSKDQRIAYILKGLLLKTLGREHETVNLMREIWGKKLSTKSIYARLQMEYNAIKSSLVIDLFDNENPQS